MSGDLARWVSDMLALMLRDAAMSEKVNVASPEHFRAKLEELGFKVDDLRVEGDAYVVEGHRRVFSVTTTVPLGPEIGEGDAGVTMVFLDEVEPDEGAEVSDDG